VSNHCWHSLAHVSKIFLLTILVIFVYTGIAYECDKVTLDSSGAPRCPRCHDRVYYNEEKKAIGKSWHKRCFICGECTDDCDIILT